MNIQILEMIEGARQAKGLTVIIDVFRAFSLECYLMAKHPAQVVWISVFPSRSASAVWDGEFPY